MDPISESPVPSPAPDDTTAEVVAPAADNCICVGDFAPDQVGGVSGALGVLAIAAMEFLFVKVRAWRKAKAKKTAEDVLSSKK